MIHDNLIFECDLFATLNGRTPRATTARVFFFSRIYEVPQRKPFLSVAYFCSQSLALFLSFFFVFHRVTCRESLNPPVHFCTSIFAVWLSAHCIHSLSYNVSTCHKSILSLYYLTITQIYLSELSTNSPTKIKNQNKNKKKQKKASLSSQGWASL